MGCLCAALASTTIAAGIWAFQMTSTVAAMTATAASAAIENRKKVSKAVAKAKAKFRLQRTIVAIPIVGIAAIGYFEEQDYQEWLSENPEGSRKLYTCEVASLSAEVADEVLQSFPERLRPEPATIMSYIPEC